MGVDFRSSHWGLLVLPLGTEHVRSARDGPFLTQGGFVILSLRCCEMGICSLMGICGGNGCAL